MRPALSLFFLFACALSGVAEASPAAVYLIRHAEKPADDADPHLSPKGRERAQALVRLFDGRGDRRFARVTHIFAAKPSHEGGSRRSLETMAPLAAHLSLGINRYYSKDTTANLATRILNDSSLDGAVVVVTWPRDEIPELAYELGVEAPPAWRKETFDRVWYISFEDDEEEEESRANLRDLPMRLLPGDSA